MGGHEAIKKSIELKMQKSRETVGSLFGGNARFK
jgi:hypothetical protein